MADLDSQLSQMAQQNAELARTIASLIRDNEALERRVNRLEQEYFKHSHAALDALPS